jgi:hypothetical protein
MPIRWLIKLLQGQAGEAARPSVCRALGRELSADREIEALSKVSVSASPPIRGAAYLVDCGLTTNQERKRRRDEVKRLVLEFEASGSRSAEFCRDHGLALSIL